MWPADRFFDLADLTDGCLSLIIFEGLKEQLGRHTLK
jgi:hypothetical protein